MAVINPLKVVVVNWPEGKSEKITVENHPAHPEMGSREVTFSRELYIEQEDYLEDPPKKFFRLFPDGEVRLKGAYIIKCTKLLKTNPARLNISSVLGRYGQPFRYRRRGA